MASEIIWNGDKATAHVRGLVVKALYRMAIATVVRAKELLSVPGTGAGAGAGSRLYGAEVSAPGEPPRKQTGDLRASVAYVVDEDALTASVGAGVEYGLYLEFGTRRGLEPRPWLRPALADVEANIERVVRGGGV